MDFIEAPAKPREQTISDLREVSRRLVRELGFMRSTLAQSDLPPSAVHAILEIAGTPEIQHQSPGHSPGICRAGRAPRL